MIGTVDFGFGSRSYLSLDGRLFPTRALPDGIAGSRFVGHWVVPARLLFCQAK